MYKDDSESSDARLQVCEICGESRNDVSVCRACGIHFCADCGYPEKHLCFDCGDSNDEDLDDETDENLEESSDFEK